MRKQLGRYGRRSLVVAFAMAAGLLALQGPAVAAPSYWDYSNLKTTDSRPGGVANGRIWYERVGFANCFNTWLAGTVKDIEADGYGVVVYIRYHPCGSTGWAQKEAGYISGNGNTNGTQSPKVRGYGATALICLKKNGVNRYCRQA